ncbi:MAG: hypothetical protein WA532_08340 [Candidatus Korobacteraceae bacterium]
MMGIQIFRTSYCIADGTIGVSTIGTGKVDDAAKRLAYSRPAMAYCSHCGRPTTGRFCSACGSPIARDAVASVTADLLRRYKKMILIVAALCLVVVVAAALVVSRVRHMERSAAASRPVESPAPAVQRTTPAQSALAPAMDSQTNSNWQPLPPPASVPSANHPAVHSPSSSIDPQEVQRALNTLVERSEQGDLPTQTPASTSSSGSDRYPNSQPVEVKDVSLPDIGVPVASVVYTTTDSIAAVVDYYRQRYPEAEVTEVNGQKIVAVNQTGAIKVIAIGSAGTETRIAIVQPAQ